MQGSKGLASNRVPSIYRDLYEVTRSLRKLGPSAFCDILQSLQKGSDSSVFYIKALCFHGLSASSTPNSTTGMKVSLHLQTKATPPLDPKP